MSDDAFASSNVPQSESGLDDLQRLIRRAENEKPGFREARADLLDLNATMDSLVALRKSSGRSQADVAREMGVKQPTVSQFETESSDPKLSTIQRYARAVGARLRLELELPVSSADSSCAPSAPRTVYVTGWYPTPGSIWGIGVGGVGSNALAGVAQANSFVFAEPQVGFKAEKGSSDLPAGLSDEVIQTAAESNRSDCALAA